MKKLAQVPGLGRESAEEFAFQPGALVTIDKSVYPLEGVVTHVEPDAAGQSIIYVRPWGGEAKGFLAKDLQPVMGRESSTIDRFLRATLTGEH